MSDSPEEEGEEVAFSIIKNNKESELAILYIYTIYNQLYNTCFYVYVIPLQLKAGGDWSFPLFFFLQVSFMYYSDKNLQQNTKHTSSIYLEVLFSSGDSGGGHKHLALA